MAFYLQTIDGSSVDLPQVVSVGSTIGDYVEFDVQADSGNPSGIYRLSCGQISSVFKKLITVEPTFALLRVNGSGSDIQFNTNYTQPAVGERFTLRVQRVGVDTWEGFIGGASIGTGVRGENLDVERFGAIVPEAGLSFLGRIYSVKFSADGGNSETTAYEKQTLNGSNDTVFPDTVGGNDGTLVNFPTDNSQWVFFDDGGGAVTVDGATTLPSLTATGNASATLPQPSLSASINLTQLSATGSASATIPNPQLDAVITFNAFTATGAAQATLPQPVVSASITMPSLTALGAAEATEPSFTVSGNVTLQPPTVTGSVSATLPQPSISGNITLPSIQASGFIIGGEIVITVELETNINEPQLSVNITEPTLSTNITE